MSSRGPGIGPAVPATAALHDLGLSAAAALGPNDALERLGSGASGISTSEAAARLVRFGPNALGVRRTSALLVLIRQIRNPILVLLLAAALVSGLTGGGTNALIIAVIVVASVGLGFANEYRAELAMDALRSTIRHDVEVLRDGRPSSLAVTQLVPGDVVVLRVGTLVPADVRLLEVDGLECDEGVLTGESMPVAKSAERIAGAVPRDPVCCAFMGTIVHQGSGRGVVVVTGAATEFGQIAAGLAETQGRTAFEAGLARFSRLLFAVAGVLTVFIFAANLALSRPLLEALLFSLAIAVGIAPEMMPAIVTVSLSSGSRALAARRVLVKRLVAIEDLGNIELLFTDKTGTLTEGSITFELGLAPDGGHADRLLLFGLLCNDAALADGVPVGGNALDQALWRAEVASEASVGDYTRLAELPFDHDRQLSSVLVSGGGDPALLITKGAPEAVLARCRHVPAQAEVVLAEQFARGARVVAVAIRAAVPGQRLTAADEHDLELAGFLTFSDPPKPDAGPSIAALRELGIEVKIITGDNGVVAEKVCDEIGLQSSGTLTGLQVDGLSDEELARAILETTIFARIGPDQKARVVKVSRRNGKDVAFLGDGINDAVALHHADVGISVDSGTDVAKDAADVVLLDKDLGMLAAGVMEGRRIFANTMKYVLMSTSSNFGNMFSAAGASAFLSFLPMLPTQILLNNLLYNAGQLVIPTDRVDPEAVRRPAAWDLRFIRRFMMVFGPVSSIFDFLTFWVMLSILNAGHDEFRSGWFVESIATQTLVVYVIRTRRIPFVASRPSLPMLAVPTAAAAIGAVLPYTPLAATLGFTALPAEFFLILVGMVAVYLGLVEVAKSWFYRAPHAHVSRPDTTLSRRRERHIRRRAHRFGGHPGHGWSRRTASGSRR